MKYIDSEKLIAEIERLNSLVPYESKDRHDEGLHDAYKAVKNVITSLQQERPKAGLDVSEFCQPVPKNIADCVAEHFWEMLGDEEKEDINSLPGLYYQEQPEDSE